MVKTLLFHISITARQNNERNKKYCLGLLSNGTQNMQNFLSSKSYLHQCDIKSTYSEESTQIRVTPALEPVVIVSSGNISYNDHTLATLTKHIMLSFSCNPSFGLFFLLLIDFYLDAIYPRFTSQSLWAYQSPSCILKGVDIIVIKSNNCMLTALSFSPGRGTEALNPDLVKLLLY